MTKIPISLRLGIPVVCSMLAVVPLAAQDSVPRPPKPVETVTGTGPNGATMRCKDGTYLTTDAPATACDSNGGILVRFPLKRVPQTAPRLERVPAPTVPTGASSKDSTQAASLVVPFENRAGVTVPAQRPPAGATLQCGDGTFVVRDTSSTRCVGKGGVRIVYPPPRRP